jgi:hypothetical protein
MELSITCIIFTSQVGLFRWTAIRGAGRSLGSALFHGRAIRAVISLADEVYSHLEEG